MAEAVKEPAAQGTPNADGKTGADGKTAATTPPADTKGDAGKGGAADAAAGADGKGKEPPTQEATTPKAPAKYELKVPDAHKARIGSAELKFFEEVARSNDWTQEDAQAEVEKHIELAIARETEAATAALAAFTADPDYGGDNLAQTQLLAQRAVNRIFPEGHKLREPFQELMSRPIVKDNLLYAAALAEVGRMMGEDTTTGGRAPAGGTKDAASSFYDHPTSKALEGRT